ncbi:MAG TPA: hypothetical protein VJ011_07270 [Steroidobacteraceae bacterium]|nr:hypothetical protein [Steroidobacteraceae bacterium]
MSDTMIPAPDGDRLAGLVFELASQLHVERAQRLALEAALVEAGVLAPAACERLLADAQLRRRTQDALEQSMAKLLRVITERADPRAPLRPES